MSVEDLDFVKIQNLDDPMVISVEDNHYVVIRNLDDLNAFIYNNIFYKFYKILIRSCKNNSKDSFIRKDSSLIGNG